VTNPTIFGDGTKTWYDDDQQRHRVDGPAVTFINGSEHWFIHGRRHRSDGPAVIYPTGDYSRDWYINGTLYYTNKSYQEAADLTDEEMIVIILKYGNVT
jgi:hypothetical protein